MSAFVQHNLRPLYLADDRPPVVPPPPYPPAAPRRSHRRRYTTIIFGAFLTAGLVILVVSSAQSRAEFSAQDKHYLEALYDPCAHGEVFDTTRCRNWGQARWTWPDDQTLIKDAHDVCIVESGARTDAKIPTGGRLIAARHPNYFDLQVGLEEVAARNIYCPNVIRPLHEKP